MFKDVKLGILRSSKTQEKLEFNLNKDDGVCYVNILDAYMGATTIKTWIDDKNIPKVIKYLEKAMKLIEVERKKL